VCKRARRALVAPLYVAGWAIVAGAVVMRALVSRDKQRQEKSGEDTPPGYITGVTGSHNGHENENYR